MHNEIFYILQTHMKSNKNPRMRNVIWFYAFAHMKRRQQKKMCYPGQIFDSIDSLFNKVYLV